MGYGFKCGAVIRILVKPKPNVYNPSYFIFYQLLIAIRVFKIIFYPLCETFEQNRSKLLVVISNNENIPDQIIKI